MNARPARYEETVEAAREARKNGTDIFPPSPLSDAAEEMAIPGPAGEVNLRLFRPAGALNGVYMHIHGGGWALGSLDGQDGRMEALAEACSVAVVSVGYRLAPEHPHPAGNDDCEAAALWLAQNAKDIFGSDKLIIGGESAGAHLSVCTLLRLRDKHGLAPFADANLVYGAFDLTLTPSVRAWGERRLVLTTKTIEWFTEMFVPDAAKRSDPDVSPLYADLHDLPPALFSVGTLDPLLDDTLFMESRWRQAGNGCELAVYAGGIHGFNNLPTALGEEATQQMYDFVRRSLADG